jgi:hypothetical protein
LFVCLFSKKKTEKKKLDHTIIGTEQNGSESQVRDCIATDFGAPYSQLPLSNFICGLLDSERGAQLSSANRQYDDD